MSVTGVDRPVFKSTLPSLSDTLSIAAVITVDLPFSRQPNHNTQTNKTHQLHHAF